MLMLIAKLGSPEIVGVFSLGLAISAPIIFFSELQLRAILSTDVKDEYIFSEYLGLRIVTSIFALALITAIAITAGYSSMVALVVITVGLSKAFEATSDIFLGLFQKCERIDRLAFSLILKGVLSFLAIGLGFYLSESLLWAVVALCLARLFVLFGYDVPNAHALLKGFVPHISNSIKYKRMSAQSLSPSFHLKTMKKITRIALPLGIVTMLISLNGNIPRYFIEHYIGTRELGIFSAIAYIVIFGGRVIVATGHAIYPRLARYYIDGRQKELTIFMAMLLLVAAVLGISGILAAKLAGREILTLLYTTEYSDYSEVFLWLMVAAGFRYMTGFLNYLLTASRFLKIQVPLTSISIVTLLIGCFLLIPKYELIGAAYAVTLASAALFIGHAVVVTYILIRMKRKTFRTEASVSL
jgi:O-antigen/teichoic acid export membrane protein